MLSNENIITQTKQWIATVVIGCNFCPFANKVFVANTIDYVVLQNAPTNVIKTTLANTYIALQQNASMETVVIILPYNYTTFASYLSLISIVENQLKKLKLSHIFQIASFHPLYIFTKTDAENPGNFTNRSPYPMLHILRQSSVTTATISYKNVKYIPTNNIAFTHKMGLNYMQQLLLKSMELSK